MWWKLRARNDPSKSTPGITCVRSMSKVPCFWCRKSIQDFASGNSTPAQHFETGNSNKYKQYTQIATWSFVYYFSINFPRKSSAQLNKDFLREWLQKILKDADIKAEKRLEKILALACMGFPKTTSEIYCSS